VKALVFRHNFAREAVAKVRSALGHRAFVAPPAPTRLEDVPEPVPPAPDWVLCDTAVAGICGSDTKQIFLNGRLDNPLTALLSFPHVLGHEAVARRSDTGERVVLNPWLTCGPRGIDPPCPACAEGRYPSCRNFDQGAVSPALHLGNCAAAPGAHAERFAAHSGQLFRVPDGVSDDAAVLADPASVSLRTILLHPPDPSAPALVYGCGTLAAAAAPPAPVPGRRGVGCQPSRRPRRARGAHGRARGAAVAARPARRRGRPPLRYPTTRAVE
jgi:threonine dehydrogenase-like Zn-dependent dehydrogenase